MKKSNQMSNVPKKGRARRIVAEALLHEHDYVESLIPMYRQFQMQLVRFALYIYIALIGLIAVGVAKKYDLTILYAVLALVSYPISFLVLAFATTEIRIARASRHVSKTIAPILKELSGGFEALNWEIAPGRHLNSFERFLSTSISLIVVISAPALAASIWYIISANSEFLVIHRGWAMLGLMILLISVAVAMAASIKQETLRK